MAGKTFQKIFLSRPTTLQKIIKEILHCEIKYSWPSNDMDLNCMGLLKHGFVFSPLPLPQHRKKKKKTFLFPFDFSSRVGKKLPSGFRERRRQKPWCQGDVRGTPQSLLGSGGSQSCLRVGFPKRYSSSPAKRSLRASQPAAVSQVTAHLLGEFHLLIQEVVLREVTESAQVQARACRYK